MKIVKLMGGLGNQMFQYALSKSLKHKGIDIKLDNNFLSRGLDPNGRKYQLDCFNIDIDLIDYYNESKFREYIEPSFEYDPEVFELKGNYVLKGFWQSYKYFGDIENSKVRSWFVLKGELSEKYYYICNLINRIENSISIHFRRTDYVEKKETYEYHGSCFNGYYFDSLSYLNGFVNDPVLFIFSDDIEWVKENFKTEFRTIFVSEYNLKDYEELNIMSRCKYHIIANSSFSWWGSFLSDHSGLTVVPKSWFKSSKICTQDLILKDWKLISSGEENICNNIDCSRDKVSILLPVYNGERYLEETLRSILCQTFKNFEIVVIDDGSTDKSVNIIHKYMLRDRRIRLVKHSKNKCLAAARNTGFKHICSDSKYILSHDCDDISYPNKLEKLVDYLNNNEDISVVGTLGEYFEDETGKIVGNPPIECLPNSIHDNFHKTNHMIVSSCLVRREVYDNIIPFNESFNVAEDYDFWARSLMFGYKLANIPEVLHKIRLRPNSLGTANPKDMGRIEINIRNRYRTYLNSLTKIGSLEFIGKIKVGLLIVATSETYYNYAKVLIESARKYFLTNCEVTYFLFTDQFKIARDEMKKDVKIIEQDHMDWPGPTLLRYEMFYNNRDLYNSMNYLFYCDADMLFVDVVGREILGEVVATQHPGFYLQPKENFPIEKNNNSKAYIDINEIENYYCGGFQGGSVNRYLEMCGFLSRNIREDLSNNIISIFDDESHANRWWIDNPPTVILDPRYCYASDEHHKSKKGYPKYGKLLALDKYSGGPKSPRPKLLISEEIPKEELIKKEILYTEEDFEGIQILEDVTMVVPVIVENVDKVQNVQFLLEYLYNYFDVDVVLLEMGVKPILKDFPCFVKHVYRNFIEVCHKSVFINDVVKDINTNYIIFNGPDVFLKPVEYVNSIKKMKVHNIDVLYPFDRIRVISRKYLNRLGQMRTSVSIDSDSSLKMANDVYGGIFLVNSKKYKESGMENRNLIGKTLLDEERFERFNILGYDIRRNKNVMMYHINHFHKKDKYIFNDQEELKKILNISKSELKDYIRGVLI